MIWIETFFSHFGAMRCKKMCDKTGIAAKMMPVPRMLSSSCGTCVRMEADCADVQRTVTGSSGKRKAADLVSCLFMIDGFTVSSCHTEDSQSGIYSPYSSSTSSGGTPRTSCFFSVLDALGYRHQTSGLPGACSM